MKRYDCFTFSGDMEVLKLRLETLDPVIDYFVIVEVVSERGAGGGAPSQLRARWPEIRRWARKIRHVVVDSRMVEGEPSDSPAIDRAGRGLADISDGDVVFISNLDCIPAPSAVQEFVTDQRFERSRFLVRESVLALNYANTLPGFGGVAVRAAVMAHQNPSQLLSVMTRDRAAAALESMGWCFTHIGDMAAVDAARRKRAKGRWRSLRRGATPDSTDLVREHRDLLLRSKTPWSLVTLDNLPAPVQADPGRYESVLVTDGEGLPDRLTVTSAADRTAEMTPGQSAGPIIICPYLNDEDEQNVRLAFGLDDERGRRLPFFFWQDMQRIGPERAFEHCWSQFPDRDVIIIHPDMRPMPDDPDNTWFERLRAYVEDLPDAGVIGCDLIFPAPTDSGELAAQCVGGKIRQGKIKHVGGRNHSYDGRYRGVRQTEWATFGGVYIRREAIDMCGSFDDDYKWAYVMDVDYCMRVQLHGLRTYQVPVNLIHEENGTTKDFLVDPVFKAKMDANFEVFGRKWLPLFRGGPQLKEARAPHKSLPHFPGG